MSTTAQITALMYHRVDWIDTDPWGICVAPNVFEEQIQYVTSRYPVVSVAEAVQQLSSGNIQEHSICITFDDGYADNYVQVKPILERYNCPATFFIPTAFIGATEPFWWDELEYIFLHLSALPTQLCLHTNGQAFHYTLNDATLTDDQRQQHLHWKWYDASPTDRCSIFLNVWEKLRPLPQEVIQQHIIELRDWACNKVPTSFRLPMNNEQLQSFFKNTLFTAGLHTHTHIDLSTKNEVVQMQEIEQGKKILQAQFHLDNFYLAYPYGRYSDATLDAVKQLKLAACFTTEAVAIITDSDVSTLGRYQVGNWNVDELRKRLSI